MLKRLREIWAALKAGEPGRRFQDRHRRIRERRGKRVSRSVIGTGLVLTGIVLLFLPGPGTLLLIAGAGLLGGESLAVARMLDRLELRVRDLAHRFRRSVRS